VVCLGELFRDCLPMERLDSCFDDYALPLQLTDSHCPRVSRNHFSMKLGALGEDRLLSQILLHLPGGRARKGFAGAGGDCAIVETPGSEKYLVLKTDCVVEGVHFVHGSNASDVGWKAMMRPLSDFAAASAVPQFSLITLIAPQQTNVAWVRGLYRGLRRAADR